MECSARSNVIRMLSAGLPTLASASHAESQSFLDRSTSNDRIAASALKKGGVAVEASQPKAVENTNRTLGSSEHRSPAALNARYRCVNELAITNERFVTRLAQKRLGFV